MPCCSGLMTSKCSIMLIEGSPLHRTGNTLKVFCVADSRLSTKLYSGDKPSITQLIEEADDNLFGKIRYNPFHPLHHLLPRQTDYSYSLRSRSHNLELTLMIIGILLIVFSFNHNIFAKVLFYAVVFIIID